MLASNSPYKHTQVGYVILISVGAGLVFILGLLGSRFNWVGLAALVVVGLCLVAFCTLTVEVTADRLRFWFGPGFPRKTIPVQDIQSVRVVANSPFFGWGIHWFGPGWLYNVSGLRAIELELQGGRKLRIGSDEPEALAQAVAQ